MTDIHTLAQTASRTFTNAENVELILKKELEPAIDVGMNSQKVMLLKWSLNIEQITQEIGTSKCILCCSWFLY